MKTYLLIPIFAAAVFLGTVHTASACSCANPEPGVTLETQVQKELNSATAIFVGKVVSTRYPKMKAVALPETFTKFAIERSWKGSKKQYITVRSGDICGYRFKKGKKYIVYSYSSFLYVSSCGRTSGITTESQDEAYLGKARIPKKS